MGTGSGLGEPTSGSGWRRFVKEAPRPTAIRNRPDAHWLVVGTVCLGAFMGQLDASIVTLAFPTLQHRFGATIGEVQWVGLTYLLALAVTLPMVGRMADQIGRKFLYTNGFIVFIVGSALCGLAPSLALLDAFRVLQACGAAMMQANSVAIIVSAMPPAQLGRGVGVQGAAQAVGLALGPVIGGLLIALGGWRLIFFVNVPVGIIGTLLGRYLIPRSRHLSPQAEFDWAGFAALVPAVGALFLALSLGNTVGWHSRFILGMFAVSVVCFVLFIRRERRAAAPMVQLALLRVRAFSVGIASALMMYVSLFGILFVAPFFLEGALHASASTTGLELLTMPAALGIVAPFAGRMADRAGPKIMVVGGMFVASLSLVALALLHDSTTAFLSLLGLLGVGLGMAVSPNNAATVGAAPKEHSGVASGVLNMSRGVGTAMGLSLTGLIYEHVVGSSTASTVLGHGFALSALFLAAIAMGTAALSLLLENGGALADQMHTLE